MLILDSLGPQNMVAEGTLYVWVHCVSILWNKVPLPTLTVWK